MKQYLFGKLINFKQKADYMFRSIYGIGHSKSDFFLARYGLSKGIDLRKFKTIKRFVNIEKLVKTFITDIYLKKIDSREISLAIKNWSYKGKRRKDGLPLNGQRTHSNAQTSKKAFRSRATIKRLAKAIIVGAKRKKGKK